MPKLTLRDVVMIVGGGLVVGGLVLLVSDYRIVRARAYNGQLAYEYIKQRVEANANAQRLPPVVAPTPASTPKPAPSN